MELGDAVRTGGDPQPASPKSATVLAASAQSSIEFHPGDDGKADSLTLRGNNELRAQRLAEWSPVRSDLDEYAGRYFSEELETFYRVRMGEKGLLIQHRRLDDVELEPKIPDSFNGSFPIAEVAFQRDEEGNLTGMMVSNIRTKNIWFERQE